MILDYVPRLVDANRAYRVTAAPRDLNLQSRFWTPGAVVTDQGTEGACVGHGVVNEHMASPVRGKLFNPNATALHAYREAQKIDEWEGESYDGTSVRAGMLVGRQRGWWSGFSWAFNMAELRALLETGPVVIGVDWRSSMYTAPGGRVNIDGYIVGGHCLLLTGYTPNWNRQGPHYRWRNSWGASYGVNGNAYIAAGDLYRILFAAGGEAAAPAGRAA